jgi:hypothetical protein
MRTDKLTILSRRNPTKRHNFQRTVLGTNLNMRHKGKCLQTAALNSSPGSRRKSSFHLFSKPSPLDPSARHHNLGPQLGFTFDPTPGIHNKGIFIIYFIQDLALFKLQHLILYFMPFVGFKNCLHPEPTYSIMSRFCYPSNRKFVARFYCPVTVEQLSQLNDDVECSALLLHRITRVPGGF